MPCARAQAEHGFSQAVAHRMAILAMHQTGMMLCAMHARLQPAETLAAIRRAIAESRIPVWLPLKLADGDTAITRDWKTTSDGLAARLAERLGGAPVVLVKSCRVPRSASAARLAKDGIVDPTFAAIVERARLSWRVVGAGDEAELADLLGSRPSIRSTRPGRPCYRAAEMTAGGVGAKVRSRHGSHG